MSDTTSTTQQIEDTTKELFFEKITEYAAVLEQQLIDVAPHAAEALLNLVQFKGDFILLWVSFV